MCPNGQAWQGWQAEAQAQAQAGAGRERELEGAAAVDGRAVGTAGLWERLGGWRRRAPINWPAAPAEGTSDQGEETGAEERETEGREKKG